MTDMDALISEDLISEDFNSKDFNSKDFISKEFISEDLISKDFISEDLISEDLILEEIKIHHIGYLVKNIKRAINEFIRLGYQIEKEPVYDSFRNVNISFLIKDGYRIELVSPMRGGGGVGCQRIA